MSWIARSLANLGVEDDDDDDYNNNYKDSSDTNRNRESPKPDHDDHQTEASSDIRGVKEDLSELTKTLTRQLWGVASFLAPPPSSSSESSQSSLSPPPPPPPPPPLPQPLQAKPTSSDRAISDWDQWDSVDRVSSVSEATSDQNAVSESTRIAGIRSDFAEIGGRFRTGISRISNHKAVSEFSKIASTFLPFGSEEADRKDLIGDAVGVTNEVLAFARNISMHPETWLDFPLADDEDSDDFDMSDAQQEHALAVERLAPRLAALRIELCPSYMSEGCFWKIYFVLLHPRLNKHDAELLSTPQIVEARAMMHDIQIKTKSEPEWPAKASYQRESSNLFQQDHHYPSSDSPAESMALKTFASEPSSSTGTNFETDKHPVVSSEMQMIDKSVVEEEPVMQNKSKDVAVSAPFKPSDHTYEEDDGDDDWLQEDDSSEMAGFRGTTIPLVNEDDVSFSDLEEDDDGSRPISSKAVANISDDHYAAPKESLANKSNKSETKDSSDWLDVDEIDIA